MTAAAAGAAGSSSGVGFDSAPPSLLAAPPLLRKSSSGSAVSRLSKDVTVTVVDAAGLGKKKIKKLMPSRVTKDPEMDELDKRLGNTKKVPLVINEVGKRLLGKSGPGMQRQVEKLGMNLIKIRTWFHPLHLKHLVGMVMAITAHMLLQMWLYHTSRFNVYMVMMCLGQFTNKLYKRWGKAFVMAVKEADRSRRTRLALTQFFAATPPPGPGQTSLSQNASSRSTYSGGGRASFSSVNSSQTSSSSSRASSAIPLAIADGSSHSAATLPLSSRLDGGGVVVAQHTPSFAPPGTMPASGYHPPLRAPGASRRKSSFFDFSSPTRNRRGSATASGAARGNATTNGGGGGDGGSSHGSGKPEGRRRGGSRSGSPPRGRRGTTPYLGTPGLATVVSSGAASEAASDVASGAGLSAGVLVRGGSAGGDGGRGGEVGEEGVLSPHRRHSHAAAESVRPPGVGSPGPGNGTPPTSSAPNAGGGGSGRKPRRWTLPLRKKGQAKEGNGGTVMGAVSAFKAGNGSAKGGKGEGAARHGGKGRGAGAGAVGGGNDSFFRNGVTVSAHGRVEGGGGGGGGGGGSGSGSGGGGSGGGSGGGRFSGSGGRGRERRSSNPGTLPPRHRPRRAARRGVRWGRVLAALLTLFVLTAAVVAAAAAYTWGWDGESAINFAIVTGRRWAYTLKGNGITLIDAGRRWTMELLERFFDGGVEEARARAGIEAAES